MKTSIRTSLLYCAPLFLGLSIGSQGLAQAITTPSSITSSTNSDMETKHQRARAATATQSAAVASAAATATPTLDSEQSAFLTLINNYRAQNGAGALQVSLALQNSSQWMSTDLATNNYFSHTDSLGRAPGARLAAFGYPYYPWGENIAAGYSSAQNSLNQWITACDADASGACTYAHRQNMLNPAFKVIGIGRVYNGSSTYGWYWTTDFGGVVDQLLNTGTTSAPTITSFTATPTSVSAGQATVLSWNVSGATSLSIDNGVGNVTTVTTKSVVPLQATTYTLTATNSGGTSTAQVSVTIKAAFDVQPPTAPTIVSSVAKSSTEVDLMWSASADNVGVTGYQITKNGLVLTSVTGATTSYADTGVAAGTTYVYSIKAYDAAGNYSLASNSATVVTPTAVVSVNAVSVTPNAGSGANQTFSFAFSDSTGFANISSAQLVIAGTLTGTGSCYIYFVPASNQVYLANDAGNTWTGPATLGSSSTLPNSQCTINAAGSSFSGSGNSLTLRLAMTFPGANAGLKNLYAYVQDKAGPNSNWQTLGTWTVPGGGTVSTGPSVASVSPNAGSGPSAKFTFAFTDPKGFSDVNSAQIDIAGTLTSTGACWIFFMPASNVVYLANDTGLAWMGPMVLGTIGSTLQNSQCAIAATGSSYTGAGNSLSLNLMLSFNPGSLGLKTIYAQVQSNGGLSSNWQQMGSWTATK